VLDRSMHDHKMKEILNNENTYHKLSRDPTTGATLRRRYQG